MTLSLVQHDTPLGPMTLVASEAALIAALFDRQKHERAFPGAARQETPLLVQMRRELDAYFAGRLTRFTVPLAPRGTPFQQQVWGLLLDIGFGETSTYGALAVKLGQPSASRAVGAAVGRNPIGVAVPCHRVVGASGALTGYAGGLDRKRALLALEGQNRLFAA